MEMPMPITYGLMWKFRNFPAAWPMAGLMKRL